MADNQEYEYERNAFNNGDLTLWAKNQEDNWAFMNFNVETRGRRKNDNVFRINVHTRVSSEERKPITALLDVGTFGIFCELLKTCIEYKVVDGKEYRAPVIEFEEQKWSKGQNGKFQPDGTYIKCKLYLGKDAEGRVWIAVTSGKRNNIKFIFHKHKTVHLKRQDGSELSEADLSVLAARSYLNVFNKWVYQMLVDNYKPYEENNSGNGNRNYNNNSNNGNSNNNDRGNAQSSSSGFDADSDIPF